MHAHFTLPAATLLVACLSLPVALSNLNPTATNTQAFSQSRFLNEETGSLMENVGT